MRTRTVRGFIYAREGGICFYCLRRFPDRAHCLDHAVPRAAAIPAVTWFLAASTATRERTTVRPQIFGSRTLSISLLLSAAALIVPSRLSKLLAMTVNLKPETEARLRELSAATGRAPEDLVDDAKAGYLAELAQVREMLDSRYGNWKNGKVKPLDGEEAFNGIRAKSEERRRS